MAVFALIIAVALLAPDPDGVVVTAPDTSVDLEAVAQPAAASTAGATQQAVPHGLSTDQQIDRWLAGRSTADKTWAEAAREPATERRTHGEVSFGIGTGGYRDYGATVSLPLGEHGRLDISYRQVENGYPYTGFGRGDYDGGGHANPAYQAGDAAEYESRVMRPNGPSRWIPLLQPDPARDD